MKVLFGLYYVGVRFGVRAYIRFFFCTSFAVLCTRIVKWSQFCEERGVEQLTNSWYGAQATLLRLLEFVVPRFLHFSNSELGLKIDVDFFAYLERQIGSEVIYQKLIFRFILYVFIMG